MRFGFISGWFNINWKPTHEVRFFKLVEPKPQTSFRFRFDRINIGSVLCGFCGLNQTVITPRIVTRDEQKPNSN